MFNSHKSTPSHRVTTRQPQHNSHRCSLFQVQRKHRLHRNPSRRPATLNPKAPTSPTPTLAAVKPPRVELPPVTPSAKTQVQRITRLYPPSSKEETRLNLNYPNYPTPTRTAPSCPSYDDDGTHLNLNCPTNSTHADPIRPHQNQKNLTTLNLTPPSKCVALLSQLSGISDKPQTKSDPNQTCHNHR